MTADRRSEIVQLSLLVAMFLGAVWGFATLEDPIPVHFDISGQADRTAGKVEGLLAIPLTALAVYALLRWLPRLDPGRDNYPRFAGAYAAIRIGILAVLAVAYGAILAAASGLPINVTSVVSVGVGLMLLVVGNFMGKIRPNWFVGMRTPWTLSSKRSWIRTHRLTGWLLIAAGLAFVVSGFLGSLPLFALAVFFVLAGGAGAVVYSYAVWRGDPDKIPPSGTSPTDDPNA